MELGISADSRTPLTAAAVPREPLHITASSPADKKTEGPPRGGWRAPGYPYIPGNQGAYHVTYDDAEALRQQQKWTTRICACCLFLFFAGLGILYYFRYTAEPLTTAAVSKQCRISQGEECEAYNFPSFFSENLVRLVDASTEKNVFFFRSPMPLAPGGETLTQEGLLKAMKRQAELGGLVFPKEFRLNIYSLLNERCELNREICLLEESSSLLASVQHWPLFGESVNPYDVPEGDRLALAKEMPRWCGDFLDQRVDHLYSELHLGVAAGETARAAAAAAAAAVSLSPAAAAAAQQPLAAAAAAAAAADVAGEVSPGGKDAKGAARGSCKGCASSGGCSHHHQQQQEAAAAADTAEDTAQQQGKRSRCATCKGCGHKPCDPQQREAAAAADKAGSKKHRRKQRKHDLKQQEQQQQLEQQQLSHKHHVGHTEPKDAAAAALLTPAAAAAAAAAEGRFGAEEAAGSSTSKLSNSSSKEALVLLVHCHHGRDRTGLLVGAYKLKHLGFSLADVWRDNRAFGMSSFEAVNSLLWYCLYLEQALNMQTPRCYNVYAAGIGPPQITTDGLGLLDVPWPPSTPPTTHPQQQQQQEPEQQQQPKLQPQQQQQQQQPQPQPEGNLRTGDGLLQDARKQQQPLQQQQQPQPQTEGNLRRSDGLFQDARKQQQPLQQQPLQQPQKQQQQSADASGSFESKTAGTSAAREQPQSDGHDRFSKGNGGEGHRGRSSRSRALSSSSNHACTAAATPAAAAAAAEETERNDREAQTATDLQRSASSFMGPSGGYLSKTAPGAPKEALKGALKRGPWGPF
ncbi:hypothetical protein Efla_006715 [Eimeria flavescens]